MDRCLDLAALEKVELMRLGALARDLGARRDVDRLERAREAREAHAIEVAEVRNESEESFERVIVIVGHGARRLAPVAETGIEAVTPEGIGPSHMDSKSTALSTELRGLERKV